MSSNQPARRPPLGSAAFRTPSLLRANVQKLPGLSRRRVNVQIANVAATGYANNFSANERYS
jgi:hypothetical protein